MFVSKLVQTSFGHICESLLHSFILKILNLVIIHQLVTEKLTLQMCVGR